MMRFSVESWAPDRSGPLPGDVLDPSDAAVNIDVELPLAQWRALRADAVEPAPCVLFVDGVRRIDARVWLEAPSGGTRLGLCASFAAGVSRCDGRATIAAAEVRRGLFTSVPTDELITRNGTYQPLLVAGDDESDLILGVQHRMTELEIEVAARAGDAELIVVDGPLRGRQAVVNAIGMVKSHRVSYLPPEAAEVVAALTPGERTPLFLMTTSWSRFSWYLRLPGGSGHAWAGIVRCEASADLPVTSVRAAADLTAATLPRFASQAHKDPRAPQNLYPIAGLERELRRRLGDPGLLERALRLASATSAA